MISEIDILPQDTHEQDLCITIGGDNTFLKAASCIHNSQETSILGVNSHPIVQKGKLCEMNMDFDHHKNQISTIIEYLDKVGEEDESEFIEHKLR